MYQCICGQYRPGTEAAKFWEDNNRRYLAARGIQQPSVAHPNPISSMSPALETTGPPKADDDELPSDDRADDAGSVDDD